ncbi:MAG: type I 3-dehydroquinate dehydratase [Phycisphaeraceae bacterium]|nr:type I 3-dehydroquinate dehydratase [Phycisphaeraceae bacterium]
MTLVCVSIVVEDLASALADAQAAKRAGADLVEWRLDGFFSGGNDPLDFARIVRLVSESPLPCIATCRPVAEGGHYDGDDAARIALFEALGAATGPGSHPPRFLDVEYSTYVRSANLKQKVNLAVGHPGQVRDLGTSLVLSLHDLAGRPSDLTRRLLAMGAEPAAAVVKFAYRARSLRDNLEVFEVLADNSAGRPTIALAMGEFGLMSRVLAPKFGGFLTFASLRESSATAPGQPTIEDLLRLYRFREIRRTTAVYGVVGWPVAHSLSPLLFNSVFSEKRTDAVYLPLPIPPEYEHFKATLLALIDDERLGLAGCSVTLPHKSHLVRLAREERAAGRAWEIDRFADLCGAANTLRIARGPGGRASGCEVLNTDGPAAVGLLARAPIRRAVLLGAGGSARAVGAALRLAGCSVAVVNRTRARAEALADDLRTIAPESAAEVPTMESVDASAVPRLDPDAIINCTSVGMTGGPDPGGFPFDLAALPDGSRRAVVFDLVYSPARTPWLTRAQALGHPVIDGISMLAAQAAMQFPESTGLGCADLFDRIARAAVRVPRT